MSKKKCLSRSRRPLKWAWPQANKHSSESWQSWTSHSIFELTRVKKAWMMFPNPELDHWMWCVTSFWRFRCVISTTPLSDQSRESKNFATKFLMLLFFRKKVFSIKEIERDRAGAHWWIARNIEKNGQAIKKSRFVLLFFEDRMGLLRPFRDKV